MSVPEPKVLNSLFPSFLAYPTNVTHEAILYPTLFSVSHTSTHPPPPYHTPSYSHNNTHTLNTRTIAAGTVPTTRSVAPFAVPTLLPEPRTHHDRNRTGQTPILIFFEVLSGLAGLVLCLGLLRCCNSYRRTPPRDRISDIVQRHQLQVEIEELRRRPPRPVMAFLLQEPAPPYLPRPPSYMEAPAHGLPSLAAPPPPSLDYTPNLFIHPTNHTPEHDAG